MNDNINADIDMDAAAFPSEGKAKVAKPECEHKLKYKCRGLYKSDVYECTICRETVEKRYYTWERRT